MGFFSRNRNEYISPYLRDPIPPEPENAPKLPPLTKFKLSLDVNGPDIDVEAHYYRLHEDYAYFYVHKRAWWYWNDYSKEYSVRFDCDEQIAIFRRPIYVCKDEEETLL
jgi:hypothetical protein